MICLSIKLGLDLNNKKLSTMTTTIITIISLVMDIITTTTPNNKKSKVKKIMQNSLDLRHMHNFFKRWLIKRKLMLKE